MSMAPEAGYHYSKKIKGECVRKHYKKDHVYTHRRKEVKMMVMTTKNIQDNKGTVQGFQNTRTFTSAV